MSADGFVPYGYGLKITHRTCSDILPVDSEGNFENGDDVVPSPGSSEYSDRSVHTTSDGVRLVTFTGDIISTATLWSLYPEPLEWYRERVEDLCNDNQDLYNMIEEAVAWA